MRVEIFFICVVTFHVCYLAQSMVGCSPLRDIIRDRYQQLASFASLKRRPLDCPPKIRYLSSRSPYGRTGNHWIQLANLLWVAETLQFTVFINPHDKALQFFNLSALKDSFCVETDHMRLPVKLDASMSVKPLNVHSYEHMNRTFRGPGDVQLLPAEEDPLTRAHHADVMLTFFAALFGHLHEHHQDKGVLFLEQSLGGACCQYVAIQKRHFEGSCAQLMTSSFKLDDFSSEDFDLSGSEWHLLREQQDSMAAKGARQVLSQRPLFHPLCNMSAAVVRGAQAAHNLAGLSTYVLLTDHQERVPPDLQALHPIITSTSTSTSMAAGTEVSAGAAGRGGGASLGVAGVRAESHDDLLALDMFLGLHAALFVRNPYSSLLLPLQLAREVLQPSLPTSSMSRASNTSLLVLGRWFTMRDVRDVLSKKLQRQA